MKFYVLTVGWLLLFAGDAASQPSPPRNVYLITIDTLRSDHLHCYGYQRIQTPAIDQLAKQGIRFTQAFTPSPITNTSHTSILTGLLPSAHGVSDFGVPLGSSHATLAELLNQRGYRTAAFIGSVILDTQALAPGLDRGFEFYDNFPQKSHTKERWGRLERRALDVVQRAESWLDRQAAAPHFVWVHLYDPHDPYEPPAPFSETYRDRPYDGEIAYADSAVGHFLHYLQRKNWYDNALIVIVGDHGEGLGEHGEDTHGLFLYDSTTHIPLLLKLPQQRQADSLVDAQVRTIDIMPTILETLDIPAPPNIDGISLLHLEGPLRAAPGETDYPLRFGWAPLRSVRSEGYKLVEAPRPEFYDLRSDPGELHNLYVPWEAHVRKLRTVLAELKSKTPPAAKPSPATVAAGTVDELRALGYLGPGDERTSGDVSEPSLLPDPKDKVKEQNLLHIAMMASENGQSAKARSALKQALQLDSTLPLALSLLGHIESESGNQKEAAQYFRRLCSLHPNDSVAALDYARVLERSGDLAGARDVLRASLKLDPNQFAARLLLGQVYLKSKDPKSAEDEFATALLSQPGSVEAKIAFAHALLAGKKFSDAAEFLQESVDSSEGNADLFELLAQAYSGLQKTSEADKARGQAKKLRAAERHID